MAILQTINSIAQTPSMVSENVACKYTINKAILDVGFILFRGPKPVKIVSCVHYILMLPTSCFLHSYPKYMPRYIDRGARKGEALKNHPGGLMAPWVYDEKFLVDTQLLMYFSVEARTQEYFREDDQ
jgi:hypothetical protein